MTTVRVSVKIRKYLWKEFVYDVCYGLYVTYMIANALSKRYLKHSISELYMRMHRFVVWASESIHYFLKISILIPFLILFALIGMVYTISVPIVLFLAATGRIQ